MMPRQRTQTACLKAAFASVARPVDTADAAAFPEIALARQHLAKLKQERPL